MAVSKSLPIYMQVGENGEKHVVAQLTLGAQEDIVDMSGDSVIMIVVNALREVADEMEKECGNRSSEG